MSYFPAVFVATVQDIQTISTMFHGFTCGFTYVMFFPCQVYHFISECNLHSMWRFLYWSHAFKVTCLHSSVSHFLCLENDACQCQRWIYRVSGRMVHFFVLQPLLHGFCNHATLYQCHFCVNPPKGTSAVYFKALCSELLEERGEERTICRLILCNK